MCCCRSTPAVLIVPHTLLQPSWQFNNYSRYASILCTLTMMYYSHAHAAHLASAPTLLDHLGSKENLWFVYIHISVSSSARYLLKWHPYCGCDISWTCLSNDMRNQLKSSTSPLFLFGSKLLSMQLTETGHKHVTVCSIRCCSTVFPVTRTTVSLSISMTVPSTVPKHT